MKRGLARFFALFALLLPALAQAELRSFVSGSLEQIQAERAGKPFILALWSASCTHCPAELKALGQLLKRTPGLDVVLVATDTPAEAAQLTRLAAGYGLGRQAQWVFADEQPERLRFQIDRRWYGELPRTYLYDGQHRREAYSGLIPAAQLERWLAANVK
ncbi:TlpA disulfide reductase family protein [Dechloromonas sp. ZY10]|uniref:TlpA family protein disulfide reductase n=1 Tax=Dechloromonas aquae TaxID=2664436 RepID=UPI00352949C7